MSHPYYYFVASLSMINFDSKQFMPVEKFLQEGKRLLSQKDFFLLRDILSDEEKKIQTNNKVYKAWKEFNRRFRNEMVWFRAEEAGKEPLDYIRGERQIDLYLVDVIQQAAKKSNLREAEEMLDRVRWQYLEELSQWEYYNLEFIICYGLKLKILERHQELASPKGKAALDEMKTIEIGS